MQLMEQNTSCCSYYHSSWENKGHTEEGEPGEEGSGAEIEQRQQQNNEVKRDGVCFTPPAIKHRSCAVITHIVLESAAVSVRIQVWIWTYHW